jgi:hypothetical protein
MAIDRSEQEWPEIEIDEHCQVCGIATSLACSYHAGGLCANCACPQCVLESPCIKCRKQPQVCSC